MSRTLRQLFLAYGERVEHPRRALITLVCEAIMAIQSPLTWSPVSLKNGGRRKRIGRFAMHKYSARLCSISQVQHIASGIQARISIL